MHVGDNALAFLVTRGVAEPMRLALAMGAEPATLAALAGMGDIMVTCASPHSRNRRIGQALARGLSLAAAQAEIGMPPRAALDELMALPVAMSRAACGEGAEPRAPDARGLAPAAGSSARSRSAPQETRLR